MYTQPIAQPITSTIAKTPSGQANVSNTLSLIVMSGIRVVYNSDQVVKGR